MLPEKTRNHLREIIEAEIAELESSLESLREQSKPIAPDTSLGRLTRMDNLVHQGTAERILAESESRIGTLKHRLTKLDDPDYGICKKCKEPIALARLEAVPDAIFCLDCQRSFSK